MIVLFIFVVILSFKVFLGGMIFWVGLIENREFGWICKLNKIKEVYN